MGTWNTPGVDMLEGRDDLACLWDIRVLPDHRRQGVGSLLLAEDFTAVDTWPANS